LDPALVAVVLELEAAGVLASTVRRFGCVFYRIGEAHTIAARVKRSQA
jgi:hypothetical protein